MSPGYSSVIFACLDVILGARVLRHVGDVRGELGRR